VQIRDIVVIGGSAGALGVLRTLVSGLPPGFPGAIFVVLHTSPDNPGVLPVVLSKVGPLPAQNAEDGSPIRPGRIYVAPPDHHLLVYPGRVRVTRGPRESRFRPAVDPLFRTAAAAYGSRVIGVILSGGQDDGVLGLTHIKRRGGIAIVQEPAEADAPSMPMSAIRQVEIDHVLRAEDMAAIVGGLVRAPIEEERVTASDEPPPDPAEEGVQGLRGRSPGPPSPFTCPECGGALWELRDGELVRFSCHVGHAFSADSLVAAQVDGLETALWTALRALEENAALRRRMAEHARGRGMIAIAESYEQHAIESEARADVVRRALVVDAPEPTLEAPATKTRG
jgi:two-component system chemotaxis response regulator CheB